MSRRKSELQKKSAGRAEELRTTTQFQASSSDLGRKVPPQQPLSSISGRHTANLNTATNVEHFKITATASANRVIPARTQEEYKQKKKFSPRPHAHSHAFRHIRTLTYLTVSTHAYLHSSHTSWEKKSSSCTTLEKKSM